ncbi:MAG: hypothetical protein A3D92_07875 [Bacteroidetes bacterium RIFCSPHIGHO2_02_FULL_44_7]|nr:MAG: hypothetical protein A3D92_07875 [Bacteroidetes bacterium RIFCSPHIGHO2_02_FULL_44_7]
MEKLIKLVCILFFVGFGTTSFAQKMKVTGNVYDSTGVKPMKNAMVMGVRLKDSLLLGFTRTNADGWFELSGFNIDTFSLVIDHPDLDEKTYYMFGHADNYEINIPSIQLLSKAQEMEEVVIYANREPIFYRGDTLIYVADSFKVQEGAVVEDLLKKLPGIKVDKEGKITSQGQEISQVLVDGDEFFGTDPTIATKNLAADGIEQVKVYEKENEDGIGGDNEKIQVLDLRLKEDAKKGYFGRVSAASDFALTPINGDIGTNPFYEGELLLNRFNGAQKISVFALGSNTPRSSFGWGDMNKFGLENETGSGNRWDPNASSNTSGVPQTLKAGVYYSDKWGKKKTTEFGFNYSYYNDRLNATSASLSQYILTDTTFMTDDSLRNYTANQSHRINLNFETKLDSLTTLQIKPNATYDLGTKDNSNLSTFLGSDGVQSLATQIFNKDESTGYTAGGLVRLNRKFMKKKRELELRYDLAYSNNSTDGSLESRSAYSLLPSLDTTFIQQKRNDNSNTDHFGTLTYIEPLSKKIRMEFEYLFQYGYSKQDKSTFDFDAVTSDYTLRNEGLSNVFDNTKVQHRGGANVIFESSKHLIDLGVRVRNIDIRNENKITDSIVSQNITNVLPQFRYQFKPSMSKRFQFNYRTSAEQPSINDLAPVPDNSNPNRIRTGNPDLKPSYTHNLNVQFNTWQALSGRYVYAGSNFSLTDNAFATETNYDGFGRANTRTVNADGNMSGFLYSGAGFPFLGRKIELSPSFNASYYRNVAFVGGERNVTDNYGLTPALEIEFNLFGDSVQFYLSGSYGFNNAISSLNNTSTPYTIENYGGGFEWVLPKGFKIEADGNYTRNAQPGGGFYSTDFFVLNAEISKRFLKTQNLELSIRGNDILNQNINARREVNGNIITDYRTTIISRYFLMKLTYRFNNRGTKEDDFNGWH